MMARRRSISGRSIAAQVLCQVDPAKQRARPVLDSLLGSTGERQRATDLVYGTLRNRSAIDTVIRTFAGRPAEHIDSRVLGIIRVGTYELIYRPETGQHAIINEAVQSAKGVGAAKQAGFVNAVLRQIAGRIAVREIGIAEAKAARTLWRDASSGCQFDADLLPEPASDPAGYLGACFSLPRWLVDGWVGSFGFEKTRAVCLACNRRPSIYARVNTLRTSVEDLSRTLQDEGAECQIVGAGEPGGRRRCPMLKLAGRRAVGELRSFAQGLFTVQDITAASVVPALDPGPGWTILDLCAAPGVKTAGLAEATGGAARIVATDIDAERLGKVRENMARLQMQSVEVIPYGAIEQTAREAGLFDAVLLDVPCSNTGVLARRAEVRFRIRPGAVERLAQKQRALLDLGAALVKPGGRICYSTCSIQTAENQGVVRDFLAQHGGYALESEELTLPSAGQFDHDGGYVAILVDISIDTRDKPNPQLFHKTHLGRVQHVNR